MFVPLGINSWINLSHAKSVWIEFDTVTKSHCLGVVWVTDESDAEDYRAPRYSIELQLFLVEVKKRLNMN